MVADEVHDVQVRLLGRSTQTSTELLQEDDRRLSRTEHENRVDVRCVESFVEEIDGEDYFDSPVPELLERRVTRRRLWAGVNGDSAHATRTKELRHEVSMARRDAEAETAVASLHLPLVERPLRSFMRFYGCSESGGIEAPVPPRDRLEVH